MVLKISEQSQRSLSLSESILVNEEDRVDVGHTSWLDKNPLEIKNIIDKKLYVPTKWPLEQIQPPSSKKRYKFGSAVIKIIATGEWTQMVEAKKTFLKTGVPFIDKKSRNEYHKNRKYYPKEDKDSQPPVPKRKKTNDLKKVSSMEKLQASTIENNTELSNILEEEDISDSDSSLTLKLDDSQEASTSKQTTFPVIESDDSDSVKVRKTIEKGSGKNKTVPMIESDDSDSEKVRKTIEKGSGKNKNVPVIESDDSDSEKVRKTMEKGSEKKKNVPMIESDDPDSEKVRNTMEKGSEKNKTVPVIESDDSDLEKVRKTIGKGSGKNKIMPRKDPEDEDQKDEDQKDEDQEDEDQDSSDDEESNETEKKKLIKQKLRLFTRNNHRDFFREAIKYFFKPEVLRVSCVSGKASPAHKHLPPKKQLDPLIMECILAEARKIWRLKKVKDLIKDRNEIARTMCNNRQKN